MTNSVQPADVLPVILLPLLVPIVLGLLAIPITYYFRQRQRQASPEIRFTKSLLRSSFDTMGFLFSGQPTPTSHRDESWEAGQRMAQIEPGME